MANKIGWCDMTWNPVWGCRNKCEYCYARGIAKRFYNVIADKEYKYMYHINEICTGEFANKLRHFVPTFINSQFNKKLPKKPQRIFVGSMSEIYYWEKEWMERVIKKVKQYPQHTFIFLTKFPKVYYGNIFPKNCLLGVTITKEKDFEKNDEWWGWFFNETNTTFLSFEPLLKPIPIEWIGYSNIDWVIIGAETGNRKGKVIPKLDWVLEIVRYCEHNKIPVYIKDNLTKYYAECRGYKEFPEVKL